MQAAKKTFMFVVIIASIGLIILGVKLNEENAWISALLASGTHEEGEYYVTPENPTINTGEDVTFKSYTQTSTGAVEVKSDWTVSQAPSTASLPAAYALSSSMHENSLPAFALSQLQTPSCKVLRAAIENDSYGIFPVAYAVSSSMVDSLMPRTLSMPLILKNCKKSFSLHAQSTNVEGKYKIVATDKNGETTSATLKIKKKTIPTTFKDPVPEWAVDAAAILNKTKIMTGYSDGNFGSSDPVTRGQLAVLLTRTMKEVMGVDNTEAIMAKNCDLYSDLDDETHYAYYAVCEASYLNWFNGLGINTGGNFEPDKALSRREVAQILYNSVGRIVIANSSELQGLTDNDLITKADDYGDINNKEKAAVAIGAMNILGVITGTFNSDAELYEFYPDRSLNRGETAAILWRLIQSIDTYL